MCAEYNITRQSLVGMEGMWSKMFDPLTDSPPTPDEIAPNNPVPEVMAAAGYQSPPSTPHVVERDLLHGATFDAYDGKKLNFMLFRDNDNPATGGGNFPGATLRVPRGVIFHGHTKGHGPPPHTIHWHGIEPTPINDGVGHCSMEIGDYTYQWQPNFIGFYFCHCHRNTVQHFEFGLYQALLIDPPDTYWATLRNRAIPIGACRDGKFRIAANLAGTALAALPGQNTNLLTTPDPNPDAGNPWPFTVDPHAWTVPYDTEVLWVFDDRDSYWSDNAKNARATYPQHGDKPGINDNFKGNAGGGVAADKFFSFNDFHPDYWYVTGVNFPGPAGGQGILPDGIVIPPQLMSGKSGVQVSIDAEVGKTILLRVLDGAYNNVTVYLPAPATIIAWDGRSLGVPPFGFNHAYDVPAGINPDGSRNPAGAIHFSVARRFDSLIKVDTAISGFAEVDFLDTRHGTVNGKEEIVLFTGKIPFNIGYNISGNVTDNTNVPAVPLEGVTVNLTGGPAGYPARSAVTDAAGNYSFTGVPAGSYTVTPVLVGFGFDAASRNVTVTNASQAVTAFAATQAAGTWVLSGMVVSSRGAAPGIPGIVVTLSGAAARTQLTDNEGHYHFTGLANGHYIITPSGEIFSGNGQEPGGGGPTTMAYTFSPTQIEVDINGANQTVNFFRGRMM